MMSRFYFDHVDIPTPPQAAALNGDALHEAALEEEAQCCSSSRGHAGTAPPP